MDKSKKTILGLERTLVGLLSSRDRGIIKNPVICWHDPNNPNEFPPYLEFQIADRFSQKIREEIELHLQCNDCELINALKRDIPLPAADIRIVYLEEKQVYRAVLGFSQEKERRRDYGYKDLDKIILLDYILSKVNGFSGSII